MHKNNNYPETTNYHCFSKELLDKTRKVFKPYYKRLLSDEECTEVINNLVNLELLLREIAEKNEPKK